MQETWKLIVSSMLKETVNDKDKIAKLINAQGTIYGLEINN